VPLTTSVPAGQAAVLQAGANVIGEDLPRTMAEAKDAPQRVGILQNIKKLALMRLLGRPQNADNLQPVLHKCLVWMLASEKLHLLMN